MDVLDLGILASMCVITMFFAGVAALEWRDARKTREDHETGATVIQHPRSDRRVNPAA
jgi:hypothetical protein